MRGELDLGQTSAEITEGIARAVESREARSMVSLPMSMIKDMMRGTTRLTSVIASRPIEGWPNTRRATFIPASHAKKMHGDWRRHFEAERFIPEFTQTRLLLQCAVHNAGHELRSDSLKQWSVNRVGINYMKGSIGTPAIIPEHRDVESERGLVASIELSTSPGTVTSGNNLHLIIGHDVCKQAGLEQYAHGAVSHTYRVGATFADLRPYEQPSI